MMTLVDLLHGRAWQYGEIFGGESWTRTHVDSMPSSDGSTHDIDITGPSVPVLLTPCDAMNGYEDAGM